MSGHPVVLSVNVGRPRTVEYRGSRHTTAIWKSPVSGRLALCGVNLAGDDQADRSVHGGVDKAVYAYSRADYDWWESELGRPLEPGTFGENLTVAGIDPSAAVIGERWRVGSVLLEVSEPRFPCFKLGIRMDDPRFLKRFAAAGRPGTYLRISEEGELGAGDEIEVVERPAHGVTIGQFAHAFLRERDRLVEILAADQLSERWRGWILESSS
ncbi:MAG TPA: MOSC domain-containing protein [Thermoleophilaceae bacterium]|nr:MOSC domain-containing protein [Thermoleophilaceae bacterium]